MIRKVFAVALRAKDITRIVRRKTGRASIDDASS